MNKKISGLLVGLMFLLSISVADALMLKYEGNTFTTVQPPYTTTDRLTANIVLDDAYFNPNGYNQFKPTVNPSAVKVFTMSAGGQTWDFMDGDVFNWTIVIQFVDGVVPSNAEWVVFIKTTTLDIASLNAVSDGVRDSVIVISPAVDVLAMSGQPGTWSVPEPATLALFGLGLAGLGAIRRKKLAA